MISKVIKPAKSFVRVCRYLLDKREGAKLIASEGVRGYDYHKMAEDFELQAAENPNLSNPVQHIILSFPPGEILSMEKQAAIAREYLNELDLIQTQYVIVSHDDKAHKHLHIVFNRVGNDGRTIKDNYLGLKGKKKAQELTRRHGLLPAFKKDFKKVQIRQMNPLDRTRYEIYAAINEALRSVNNLSELEQSLKVRGIEVFYKHKGQTNEVQGISFKKGMFKYKGSEIDRRLSYRNLIKILAHKRQLSPERKAYLESSFFLNEKNKGLDLIYELLKPEEVYNYVPPELVKKKGHKRSKGLGL